MSLELCHLSDTQVREYMIEEFERDLELDDLYMSSRLNAQGHLLWRDLLRRSLKCGDDSTLAAELSKGLLNTHEIAHRNGRAHRRKVSRIAHVTLAEGEFNRFYIRGLCLYAIEMGIETLEIYRAKPVQNPRSRSRFLVGEQVDPAELLADLRANKFVDTALGVPAGPNSGLSVKIPPSRRRFQMPPSQSRPPARNDSTRL